MHPGLVLLESSVIEGEGPAGTADGMGPAVNKVMIEERSALEGLKGEYRTLQSQGEFGTDLVTSGAGTDWVAADEVGAPLGGVGQDVVSDAAGPGDGDVGAADALVARPLPGDCHGPEVNRHVVGERPVAECDLIIGGVDDCGERLVVLHLLSHGPELADLILVEPGLSGHGGHVCNTISQANIKGRPGVM